MHTIKDKRFLVCAIIAVLLPCIVFVALAAGGPNNGSGTATVNDAYNYGYSFDSTYYGSLSADRPNVNTSGANANVTFSGNVFTVTATSSAGYNPLGSWGDKSAQNVSTEVTITNNSGKTLVIGYTYAVSGGTIEGSDFATGTGTLTMIPGQQFFLTVKTAVTAWTAASSTATATFTITSCEEVTSYDLKVYPSQFGTYTYSVGEDVAGTLATGDAAYISTASDSDVVTLTVPTIADEYADTHVFYGWSVNGVVTPSTANYSGNVTTHSVILPVFIQKDTLDASGNGPFYVNGNYYVFWRDAFVAAGTSHPVVIARDYTLPGTMQENGVAEPDGKYIGGSESEAEYIIPVGATLLIPYDTAHTVQTTKPATSAANSLTKPSAFRTLTMASGANIVVNGAISIAGTQHSNMAQGTPFGPVGFIKMNDNSSITVNSGANLYAWGYITGTGFVTVNSGGKVYECFQISDWRGGSATNAMLENGEEIFPMSQYYVQNIEVPLMLEAGAEEYGFMSVDVSIVGIKTTLVSFIGSKGMFQITSGTMTKDYDETNDRLVVSLNEAQVSISPYTISVDAGFLGASITINSAQYVLPITTNLTLNVNSGSKITLSQDVALLPGSEVNIEEGGTCLVTGSSNVYIYDVDNWSTYCGAGNATLTTIAYAPGQVKARTADDLVDAVIRVDGTLDATDGYLYTTAGGANIYSTGTGKIIQRAGTNTVTYQATYVKDGYTAHEIPVVPAKLKNGDGNYVQSTTGTYTYCGECLQWLTSHGNATNVELGNSLNMYFAFWSSSITEETKESYYVIVTHTDASGNKITQTFTHDLWLTTTIKISDTEEQPAYVVPYRGLAAKQMGDTVQVTLYKSGTTMHTWTDSIQDYAMRMLKKYETDANKGTLRTLLVDMLNYGAACQKKFGYDTENPVNAGLSDEQQDWATETVNWDGISSEEPNYKANLIVDGNIRFSINVNDNLPYTFKNHWDKDRGGDLLYDEAGEYYYVSKLYVADARQAITIFVDGETYTDSVAAYCRRMIDSKQDTNGVFTAFMKFSNSAYNYLHDDEVNRV